MGIGHGDEARSRREGVQQTFEVGADLVVSLAAGPGGRPPPGREPVRRGDREHPGSRQLPPHCLVRGAGLVRDRPRVDDGEVRPRRGRNQPVSAEQNLGRFGLGQLPDRLLDGPRAQAKVDRAARFVSGKARRRCRRLLSRPPALHVVEPPPHDDGQLVGECRLEGGKPVLAHADERGRNGLVGPAFGGEADPGRGGDEEESGVLVAGVAEGVEAALDEGVVQGSDGQQALPEEGVRKPEHPEQDEQVVLRDAELDVLPPRRGGPRLERGDRLLAKGVGLLPGGEHPPPVDPPAEIGGDGHVRGGGDHPVRELAPRPSDGGEDPPEALLGGEPLPSGNGKLLGNGHRRDLVAAIRGLGEGHPRDVLLQHLGREREPGEPVPLRPPFDPVPAPQLVHLLHAHQARVVVLVTGERQPVALDRVGDEAGGFVAARGRLERFHHRLDVVAGEVRHQPGESFIVELVEDRPHPGDLPDVLAEALAPRRPALEHHRRVESVRAVVDPLSERVAPALTEHPLQLLAVLEGLDPPAHVPEQVVEPAVQPVGDHRVEALPVVVDNPPQVPDLVLPALQQRLEDVPLVELRVAGKGDHAPVRATTGLPFVGTDVVPDDAREEGRGDPEPYRPGREVDVVLVLGA